MMTAEPVSSPTETPPLRLLFWWFLLVAGFGYVSMALCGRATPFESGDNRWNDWLGVTLSGPTLYLLATRHTLLPFGAGTKFATFRNYICFTLPFFAGLHWEYVGQITGAQFSLTAHQLTHLNSASKIALAIGLCVATGSTALCLYEARKEGFLGRYLAAFGGLISSIVVITVVLGDRYYLHIHHYFLTLCLLPFVRFRHPVCVVTQGLLAGVFVEGAARYGLSPIWMIRH